MVEDPCKMSVIRLPPKPGRQSLGEDLHVLLDVVRKERHS
jgi:hypothetical protein